MEDMFFCNIINFNTASTTTNNKNSYNNYMSNFHRAYRKEMKV